MKITRKARVDHLDPPVGHRTLALLHAPKVCREKEINNYHLIKINFIHTCLVNEENSRNLAVPPHVAFAMFILSKKV